HLHAKRRSSCYFCWALVAETSARRAAATLECAQRRHQPDWTTPGVEQVRRTIRADDSILSFSALGEAWYHGLGASELPLRRERRGRGGEAEVRPLLHPALLTEAGRDDRAENAIHDAVWQRTVSRRDLQNIVLASDL